MTMTHEQFVKLVDKINAGEELNETELALAEYCVKEGFLINESDEKETKQKEPF